MIPRCCRVYEISIFLTWAGLKKKTQTSVSDMARTVGLPSRIVYAKHEEDVPIESELSQASPLWNDEKPMDFS